jgi:hypothetical protein
LITSIDSIGAPLAARIDQRLHLVGDHLHAALEVAVRRAEAEVGQQLLGEELDVATVRVQLGLDVRLHAAERIEVERDELDGRVDTDRAEGLARDRAEERLRELVVGERVDDLVESPLDARPDRAFVHVLAEPVPHQLDAAGDVLVVELDALDRVLLAAAPVAFLESLRRAARDGPELGVVVAERVHEQLGAVRDQRFARGGLCDCQVHQLVARRRCAPRISVRGASRAREGECLCPLGCEPPGTASRRLPGSKSGERVAACDKTRPAPFPRTIRGCESARRRIRCTSLQWRLPSGARSRR